MKDKMITRKISDEVVIYSSNARIFIRCPYARENTCLAHADVQNTPMPITGILLKNDKDACVGLEVKFLRMVNRRSYALVLTDLERACRYCTKQRCR